MAVEPESAACSDRARSLGLTRQGLETLPGVPIIESPGANDLHARGLGCIKAEQAVASQGGIGCPGLQHSSSPGGVNGLAQLRSRAQGFQANDSKLLPCTCQPVN